MNAQALAEHFGSIDALLDGRPEEIEEVEGIGPILAEQVTEELSDERTRGPDRAAARARPAIRALGRGAPRAERPARGQDLRPHRHAPDLTREEATALIRARGR